MPKIWNNEPKKPEFFLKLEYDHNNNVTLVMVDDKGEHVIDGYLLTIKNGNFWIETGANREIASLCGISLDPKNRICTRQYPD